jgi:hypothetical protein
MLELRSIGNRSLERCLDRDPANVDALFTLGWLRSRESRFAEALELSERLVRASKASGDQRYLVVVFYNVACFRLAIAPDDPDVERLALRDLKLSDDKALERGTLRAWRERAQGDADLEALRLRYPSEMSDLFGGSA